jgi:hypothetical protein
VGVLAVDPNRDGDGTGDQMVSQGVRVYIETT